MLPIYQSQIKELSLMQTQWASALNPLISDPLSSNIILQNVSLISGDNSINHMLGRKLQGWILCGMHNSFVQVYDKPSSMPDKTLILNSSGAGNISLIVF